MNILTGLRKELGPVLASHMDVNATPTATLDPHQPLSSSVPPDTFSQQLLNAMLAFRDGDFGGRMPTDLTGINGKIADA